VLVGTKLGVFEALGQNPPTAADVTRAIGPDSPSCEAMLKAKADHPT
jgi:hypothetical protein